MQRLTSPPSFLHMKHSWTPGIQTHRSVQVLCIKKSPLCWSLCACVPTLTRGALLTQKLPALWLGQVDALRVERSAALTFTQQQISLLLTNLHKHTHSGHELLSLMQQKKARISYRVPSGFHCAENLWCFFVLLCLQILEGLNYYRKWIECQSLWNSTIK